MTSQKVFHEVFCLIFFMSKCQVQWEAKIWHALVTWVQCTSLCCCCLKVFFTRIHCECSWCMLIVFSLLFSISLPGFLLYFCHHSHIFLLSTHVRVPCNVKYLELMVCPAWHKQNSFCHLSHCIYAPLINRLVPDRQAKALACVWILFSNASTTGIPNEHLDHIALQGKVANCTFQVGLYGVHS